MNTKLRATISSRTLLHEGFLREYRYETEVERHQGRFDGSPGKEPKSRAVLSNAIPRMTFTWRRYS